jgi:hypothetical protein
MMKLQIDSDFDGDGMESYCSLYRTVTAVAAPIGCIGSLVRALTALQLQLLPFATG